MTVASGPQVWTAVLDAPSSERFDIDYVDPLPGGGFRATGNVIAISHLGGFYAAVQDFDANGQPVGAPRVGPLPRLRSGRSPEPDVVVPFEPIPSIGFSRPPMPCLRRDLGDGIESRLVESANYVLSYGSGGLDGEGGAFGFSLRFSGENGAESRLFRQQADCSMEPIGDFLFRLGGPVNSSRLALAFAGSSVDNTAPHRTTLLRGFDRGGLRWSLPLSPGGETPRFVTVLQEIAGDAIVGASGDTQSALYRVDGQGGVRWSLSLGAAAAPSGAMPTAQGLLITGAKRDGIEPVAPTLWQVDPEDGRLLWTYAASEGSAISPIPLADPEAARQLAVVSLGAHSQLIALDNNGHASALRRLPTDLRAHLQLANDRVLATRGSGFYSWDGMTEPGRRLLLLDPETPDTAEPPGDAVRIAWPQRPLDLLVDGDAAFVVSLRDNRLQIESFDSGGARRWQRVLPDHPFGGSMLYQPSASLLHSAQHICVVLQRTGGSSVRSMSSLSCLQRDDGGVVFAHVDLIDRDDAPPGDVQLLGVDAEGASVLAANHRLCDTSTACPGSIDRIDIDGAGDRARRPLLVEDDARSYPAFWRLDASRYLVAAVSRDSGELRFLRLDPEGPDLEGSVDELDAGVPWTPYGYAANVVDGAGVLILLDHPEQARVQALRFAADGSLEWSRELEGQLYPRPPSGPPLSAPAPRPARQFAYSVLAASGDAAVLTIREGQLQLTRLGSDGQLRWDQAIGDLTLDSTLGLHLDDDGSLLLVLQRNTRLLLRRLSGDGDELAASTGAIDGPALAAAKSTDSGDALLIAEGSRPHAASAQPATLQRVRLDAPNGCTAPALSGFWFDPGSAGQGLFFHPAADGALLTATWLSFTADGDTDRADLRWFSLFGETDGSDPIRLEVQNSLGGRFAAAAAQSSETVGDVWVERLRCDLLAVDYRFDSGELAGQRGRLHLIPAAPPGEGSQGGGIWFDPQSEGQGLLLQSLELGDGSSRLVGAWPTFDPEGAADDPTAQHWFTLDGPRAADGSYTVDILRTIGGSFDGRATANHIKTGEATLRFEACDRLRITYRFSGNGAAEFDGLDGELLLRRLDGCAP